MTDLSANSTRDDILLAAEKRFQHYGFRKTTMAEIAGDVDMSAANLYRYFSNKEDIGAACVLRCFDTMEQKLAEVVHGKSSSASLKLRKFILAKLDHVYGEVKNNPNINELAEVLVVERPELLLKKKQVTQSLLAEILAEGNRSGEFAVDNILETSDSIVNATVAFSFPMFMQLFPLEKFHEMAIAVVNLVIRGLRP